MSRVTLYSQLFEQIAYPSAAFGVDDMRSMLGLYAFGGAITPSTVTVSKGFVALSDQGLHAVALSDQFMGNVGVSDG